MFIQLGLMWFLRRERGGGGHGSVSVTLWDNYCAADQPHPLLDRGEPYPSFSAGRTNNLFYVHMYIHDLIIETDKDKTLAEESSEFTCSVVRPWTLLTPVCWPSSRDQIQASSEHSGEKVYINSKQCIYNGYKTADVNSTKQDILTQNQSQI